MKIKKNEILNPVQNDKTNILKATATAPSNIAFIKYWGKKNESLKIPCNGSISMNLSNLYTTTTIEFNPTLKKDNVIINGKKDEKAEKKVIEHLDRIRSLAKSRLFAKVVSKNSFPSSTGLSSSASGFAALTLAAVKALNVSLSEKELSILARLGSGSACRSIPDGFVEWVGGNSNTSSYAISLQKPWYWDIADIVAVVSVKKKKVPTTIGQKQAATSPLFAKRLQKIPSKIKAIKKAIAKKDFFAFGTIIEAEALELHAIMSSSKPSLLYITPQTLEVIEQVRVWKKEGLAVFFTLNTGHNVHILCLQKDASEVLSKIKKLSFVKHAILSVPAVGARITNEHLF